MIYVVRKKELFYSTLVFIFMLGLVIASIVFAKNKFVSGYCIGAAASLYCFLLSGILKVTWKKPIVKIKKNDYKRLSNYIGE